MTMNEEIEKLEIKISYLEAGIAELNDVVIQQQKTIDSLSYSLEKMQEKLQASESDRRGWYSEQA